LGKVFNVLMLGSKLVRPRTVAPGLSLDSITQLGPVLYVAVEICTVFSAWATSGMVTVATQL